MICQLDKLRNFHEVIYLMPFNRYPHWLYSDVINPQYCSKGTKPNANLKNLLNGHKHKQTDYIFINLDYFGRNNFVKVM